MKETKKANACDPKRLVTLLDRKSFHAAAIEQLRRQQKGDNSIDISTEERIPSIVSEEHHLSHLRRIREELNDLRQANPPTNHSEKHNRRSKRK